MGNCQAVEAATVVIEHPNGRIERVYCPLTADQVMDSNPGHYVAVIVTTVLRKLVDNNSTATVRYQKLLRPGDTLHIGGFYRLVSFEEVLKEFSSKNVGLSDMVVEHKQKRKEKRGRRRLGRCGCGDATPVTAPSVVMVQEEEQQQEGERLMGSDAPDWHASSAGMLKGGQWRPTLQSIAEVGI